MIQMSMFDLHVLYLKRQELKIIFGQMLTQIKLATKGGWEGPAYN
jgi:hypothetical protein